MLMASLAEQDFSSIATQDFSGEIPIDHKQQQSDVGYEILQVSNCVVSPMPRLHVATNGVRGGRPSTSEGGLELISNTQNLLALNTQEFDDEGDCMRGFYMMAEI